MVGEAFRQFQRFHLNPADTTAFWAFWAFAKYNLVA
jgi:hypothetical protein